MDTCTYKQFSFRFVPGNVNGQPRHFVQVWLTDAMFSVMTQAWFDNYAFKFKGKEYAELPSELTRAIHDTYLALFSPTRKDFRSLPG